MSRIDMKKKAEDAIGKPAAFGPDIDLGAYSDRAVGHGKVAGLRELPAEVRDQALSVGVDTGEECRNCRFVCTQRPVRRIENHRPHLTIP
jgi:hypothetical protein